MALMQLRSQLLSGAGAPTAGAVVERLLAVQAQDERAFRLAIRSRTVGLTAVDVERCLNERQLLVTWLNRGTLHLVRTEDYWWLAPLTAPRVIPGVMHRLGQQGLEGTAVERGVAVVVGALESQGPLSRAALYAYLGEAGFPAAGQAPLHLIAIASLRGLVVRGPIVDGQHAYASVATWLGDPPSALDRDDALDMLAHRYLRGHEPATPQDLAKWAGITLGDARRAFERICADLLEVAGGWIHVGRDVDPADVPSPRLLGAFDPLLHGWSSRSLFVGPHGSVVTTNGIFRPTALAGARVVATWRQPATGIVIESLEGLDRPTRSALVADAADVERFLGVSPRPVTVQ